MDIHAFIEKMKKVQLFLIDYIENEDNKEENYENLIKAIEDFNLYTDRDNWKIFLHLLNQISNNHSRVPEFFEKIEKILKKYEQETKSIFTNKEIFTIFHKNKRILLFLIKERIVILDKSIVSTMFNHKFLYLKFPEYFAPEIKPFINDDIKEEYSFQRKILNLKKDEKEEKEDLIKKICEEELPEDFEENRKNGENEDELCQIIRKDQIEEFITYVNQKDYDLKHLIPQSIYETNLLFLFNKSTTLINYSAFFGAIQIFRYLYKNEVELKPILWIYAIHGEESEIINILEENQIKPPMSFKNCFGEALRCHHNYIATYIQNHFLNDNIENINFNNEYDDNVYFYSFRFYNFAYFPNEMKNICFFFYACEFDYFNIVKYLLNTEKYDINAIIILKYIFY